MTTSLFWYLNKVYQSNFHHPIITTKCTGCATKSFSLWREFSQVLLTFNESIYMYSIGKRKDQLKFWGVIYQIWLIGSKVMLKWIKKLYTLWKCSKTNLSESLCFTWFSWNLSNFLAFPEEFPRLFWSLTSLYNKKKIWQSIVIFNYCNKRKEIDVLCNHAFI